MRGEGEESGKGLLLALKKGVEIVFVDIEGGLVDSPFTLDVRDGAFEVMKRIEKRYPVVYLSSGMLGEQILKKWMEEKNLRNGPILSWDSGAVFAAVRKKGIRIKAVIGNPSVVDSARKYKPMLFSFEEAQGAKKVKSWEEIEKEIK